MYDVNSKHAEDFINHEEILETLAYANENKCNEALIDSLIEKAKKRKDLPTVRPLCCWPVRSRRKMRKFLNWRNRLKKTFTATAL